MRKQGRLKNNKVSILETIPSDMVFEILCRVASKSLPSIMAVKLSSKKLKEVAEEKLVYQRVTLEELPMVSWKPIDQNQEIFLHKCQLFGNPDFMYRQAVMDYFNKINMKSAYENLLKAMKSGHLGALYVTCIVFLFSGDEELKQKGIKIMGNMKRTTAMKRTFRKCRNNLMRELDRMWVKNLRLKERPVCCTTKHEQKDRWGYDEEEEDEKCEACSADREIGLISATYNYG